MLKILASLTGTSLCFSVICIPLMFVILSRDLVIYLAVRMEHYSIDTERKEQYAGKNRAVCATVYSLVSGNQN